MQMPVTSHGQSINVPQWFLWENKVYLKKLNYLKSYILVEDIFINTTF